MTNLTKTNHSLPIPGRIDFHKEFAGIVQIADFDTYKPNPFRNNPHTAVELQHIHNKKGGDFYA